MRNVFLVNIAIMAIIATTLSGCNEMPAIDVQIFDQGDLIKENRGVEPRTTTDMDMGQTIRFIIHSKDAPGDLHSRAIGKGAFISDGCEGLICGGSAILSAFAILFTALSGCDSEAPQSWYLDFNPSQSGFYEVSFETSGGLAIFYVNVRLSSTTYALTTAVSPAGSGTVTGAGTYPAGTTVAVIATPNSNWTFSHWTVNGSRGSSDSVAQVTMDSDVELVAFFRTQPEGEGEGEGESENEGEDENPSPIRYRLSTFVEGDGLIVAEPIGPTYLPGTVVTLTGVAQNGYRFNRWTGNVTSTVNPVTVTMSRDISVTAWFEMPASGDAPVITVQPHSITRETGQEARFVVQASGQNLHYQWRHNGVDLDPNECQGWSTGWNSPELLIYSVGTVNAGGYSCRVSNAFGSVETAVATLYVNTTATAAAKASFWWNSTKTTPVIKVDFTGLTTETEIAGMFLSGNGETITVTRFREAVGLRVHHFREWAPPYYATDTISISDWDQVVEMVLTNWNGNANGSGDNDRRIRTNLSLVFTDGSVAWLNIEKVLFTIGESTPIGIERGAVDFLMPAP